MSGEITPAPPGPSGEPSPSRRAFPTRDRFLAKPERVFVNRNLRFSQIGAIGFDLDHTLAHYDPQPIEKLAYELTKQKLVANRGYPKDVLRFRYDPEFVVRGLVVDKLRGNVIKMDYFRYVGRAMHGLKRIESEVRSRMYNERPKRMTPEHLVSVDTLFHLPEVYLYLQLVEFRDAQGQNVDYLALYQDVREMIDEAHRDGTLKNVIMKNVGNFVRRDPQLGVLLEEFRRSGKKLFLLTNSEWAYSQALLRHLLEKRGERSWERYFDLIVVDSRKPAYFMPDVGPSREPVAVESETGVPTYSGGTASFLEEKLGISGDSILYFGDHTYGDILRSKRSLGWRTAMIVPEVAHEVEVTQLMTRSWKTLERLAHEHDQLELDKAAMGREWRKLSLSLRGEGADEAHVLQILELYDPRARAGAAIAAGGNSGGSAGGSGGAKTGTNSASLAEELPARLHALVHGSGSGPGGRRTRGDRRRSAKLRELEELAASIADLDHRAASLAGRIRSLRRKVEAAYNPHWGSVFREGNEASRFGHQLKAFACVYTARVTNFMHYPWNYYFQSPQSVMPHDL